MSLREGPSCIYSEQVQQDAICLTASKSHGPLMRSFGRRPSLFEHVVDYVKRTDRHCEVMPPNVVRATMRAGNQDLLQLFYVDNEQERVIVYAMVELVVPPHQRAEAAQLVVRLNLRIAVGNWNLDLEKGTVRFCTTLAAPGGGQTDEMLRIIPRQQRRVRHQTAPGVRASGRRKSVSSRRSSHGA
jgi:hypothetical protein